MSTKKDKEYSKRSSSKKSHKSSHHCKSKNCKKLLKKEKIRAKEILACSIKAKDIETTNLKAENIETINLKAETIEAGTINADEIFSGCEKLKGVIEASVSLDTPCFTFDCDASVNIQTLDISKTLIEPDGTLINPLEVLPILNPPSDVVCPTPGGDPLVTATVDLDVSFQVDYLIFTNVSTPVGTDPSPDPSTGPWYFEKEPFSSSGRTVISCGCREKLFAVPYSLADQFPPIGPSTFSKLELSFDTGLIDPLIQEIELNISYGYSTESTYDFFTIIANGKNVVNVSGQGPNASDPYLRGNTVFRVNKNSSTIIQFSKDPLAYGGIDSVYFALNKVTPVLPLNFPTTLTIKRGDIIIQNYAVADLDSNSQISTLSIDCSISVQKGDQLCLNADSSVYASYNVALSLENIPQIKDHKSEETFSALTRFNEISYNNRVPSDQSVLQGWYDTDSQLGSSQVFITSVAGCGAEPAKIIIKNFSASSSGAYFLNNYFNSSENTYVEIATNLYKDVLNTQLEYRFDPSTGELRLDVENPNNIPEYGFNAITIFRPIGNPDEKYWKYNFDLKDYNHEFNTPINFYDFVSEYYKAGFLSSMFGIKSYPTWPESDYPELNPLMLDQNQVKATYGVDRRMDYDNLVRVIRDFGIERKYGVQRFVYWPYPGPDQPVLTSAQKERLQWQTNINRYPFLGFVTRIEGDETGTNYPKLTQGETVTMVGTGTRLDNFPIRLARDGYHTGPKPAPDFMQTYSGIDPRNGQPIPSNRSYNIYEEWGFYTMRLPITIDETNDTIQTRNGGITYFGEFINTTANFVTVPPSSLGPFDAGSGLSGLSLTTNNISGLVVIADPINADAPAFNNAAEINGNVVIVIFDGTGSSSGIAQKAVDAGATGLIFVSPDPFLGYFFAAANIPSINVTNADGMAIIDAVNTLTSVNIDVVLGTPVQTLKLPHGTYYLSDIYQYLYDKFNAFEIDFFIDVGNFLSPDIARERLFALLGSTQSALYGPSDPNYPSNFFGSTGIDVGYLWGLTPDVPITAPDLGLELFWGSYALLVTGEYKTHTPLTSEEAQLLIDAVDNRTVSVSAKHGPITVDMPYEKYVSCINELSMSKGTEDHSTIAPWVYACDNGLWETPVSFSEVMNKLKLIELDPLVTYEATGEDYPYQFGPTLYTITTRTTGTGHPGEFSDNYNSGLYLNLTESISGAEGSLEWIVPQERFFYPEGTIVPTIGDVSNRQVEITAVNYLDDPQWLITSTNTNPPYVGAPDYDFIPYIESSSEYAQTRPGTAPPVIAPNAVDGDWLIGTLKESKIRQILNLPPDAEVPGFGYMRSYSGDWSVTGDQEILPWFDQNFNNQVDATGTAAAARVIQYFNSRNVKHIIIDVRNVVGGDDVFFKAFSALIGDKRYFVDDYVSPVNPLEPNGINPVFSDANMQVARENAGVTTYKCNKTILDCNPQAYIDCDLLDVYPNGIWNGEITGQAEKGLKSNVVWLTNATSISSPQAIYLSMKGTSLNGTEFDGDFGKSTQMVAYGVYYRPFSTSGNYTSYINWWTRGRKGEEEVPNGLLFNLNRYESARLAYLDKQVDGKGGILKGLDQEFSRYHQPQIKWDMSADVFFQDIGFTIGNPGVNPVLDGEPWLPNRYADVDFSDPTTWRDSVLERSVQMAVDPNVSSHFYVDDGYGYVSQLP